MSNTRRFTAKAMATLERVGEDITIRARITSDGFDHRKIRTTSLALERMATQLHAGIPLTRTHSDPFAIGRSTEGWVERDGDKTWLFSRFTPDPSFPETAQLQKRLDAGDCDVELSIGGEFDPKAIRRVEGGIEVDEVVLDHVACARRGRGSIEGTGFLRAIHRALEEEEDVTTKAPTTETDERDAKIKQLEREKAEEEHRRILREKDDYIARLERERKDAVEASRKTILEEIDAHILRCGPNPERKALRDQVETLWRTADLLDGEAAKPLLDQAESLRKLILRSEGKPPADAAPEGKRKSNEKSAAEMQAEATEAVLRSKGVDVHIDPDNPTKVIWREKSGDRFFEDFSA